MSNNDEIVEKALRAIFVIIGDQDKQTKLLDEEGAKNVIHDLKLPPGSIHSLRNIINRLEQLKSENAQVVHNGKRQDIEKILLESFVHIRWSFWVSLVMSVTLFIVGMFFLVAAVLKSISEASVSTSTLTIAGIGIADFVLLFYTRPWQDISKNLSNSQQVKIIATSYLSGLALVNQKRSDDMQLLDKLTRNSISMIQKFTEEQPEGEGSNKEK